MARLFRFTRFAMAMFSPTLMLLLFRRFADALLRRHAAAGHASFQHAALPPPFFHYALSDAAAVY